MLVLAAKNSGQGPITRSHYVQGGDSSRDTNCWLDGVSFLSSIYHAPNRAILKEYFSGGTDSDNRRDKMYSKNNQNNIRT